VNAANTLIARNEGRIPKNCVSMGETGEKIRIIRSFTEQEEALQIVSAILTRMRTEQAEYSDFAILYRTNSQSRALEEQLRRRNIPYLIYSGNSFFERAEVKDVMAYMKLAVNLNDDEAFRRVVNKPARGIGDTSLQALTQAARQGGQSLFRAAYREDLETFGLRAAAVAKIRAFCDMMGKATVEARDGDAYDVAMSLASESGIFLFFKADDSVEGQSRFQNVQELLNSVKGYVEEMHGDYVNSLVEEGVVSDASLVQESSLPVVHLGEFLENVSLLSNADVADDETLNKVALMTVHSAKGLEFPYVFVAGLEENLFPSGGWLLTESDLEEERRLFYVALTRAMKVVTLSYAETRMRNGKHESNAPSRFLREIAPQYLQNPLRREDFESASSEEVSGGGFRWGKPVWASRSERTTAIKPSSSRVIPASIPHSRPAPEVPAKPPVIDANFVPEPMSSFRVGDSIEHNRFGAGKVLEITGQIPELKAKILFEKYGEKLLLLKYAKIRHK
jgi:DNA helicase-2/ATP-dependent DNA helicase PcrA